MACDQWRSKLEAYADAELSAEETRAFDAHLRSCPSCAADALGKVQWKRAVQHAGKRYVASADFRQRVEKQVIGRRKTVWLAHWLPRLAAAALVILVVGFGANRWLGFERQRAFGELADLHVATLASSTPVDVLSSDRHTVKPWFAGKIPFTFNPPDLQGTPFTLLGGRVAYLGQTPGAQLLFQIRQHRISVFIFQDRPAVSRGLGAGDSLTQQLSFNVETWSEGGLRYFVISDVAPADIHALSELLRHAAQS